MQINSNQFIPKYSVIIPTHRRATLLDRALDSIKQQDASISCEIIVVSDCIDSETDGICGLRLATTDTYVRRSGPPGPAISRNLAMKLAKGQVILFLDDDDAWHSNLLSDLENCAHLSKSEMVYFDGTVIKESRKPDGPVRLSQTFIDMKGRLTEDVFIKNQVHMSCIAFPRALLQGLEFDSNMRAYEDWDFQLSVYERQFPIHVPICGSQIHEVDDETSDRRGNSRQAKDVNALIDYLYVYRRHPVNEALRVKRSAFLSYAGMNLPPDAL